MSRLAHVTSLADVTLIAATTAPFPIVTYGLVPSGWGNIANGHVPEFDLDLTCAGASGAITDLKLYGATRVVGAVVDDTFTAANATEIMTATAHGLLTGDGPVQLTTTTTLPAGLALLTDYWIIRIDANTFYFAASLADALAGTKVSITSDGTGTHTLADTADTQLVRWRLVGILETSLSLASIREGYTVRCDHDPRVFAYGVVWTGTASNTVKATITPVSSR